MTETPNRLKVPGESTTDPSFASPNVQTAPDVATSQKVSGQAASPSVPNENSTVIPPAVANAQSTSVPVTPPKTSASTVASTPQPAAASATVPTSTGAPPGVPATTLPAVPTPPTIGLAPTPKSTQGHNAAEDEFIQAQNENAMKLYEAALTYNGGPTGALEEAQRKAETGLKTSTNNRGAAGTIDSSLYEGDKSLIARNQALEDTKAYNVYQEAVNAANEALNKAQIAYTRANEQEKREIAEQAEKREQTEAIERASAPPIAAPAPPYNPGGVRTITGPPGVGGVVPYEEKTKGGSVRVGGR